MSKHAVAAGVTMLAMGAAKASDRVYALAPGAILASHDQSEEETEVSHRMNRSAQDRCDGGRRCGAVLAGGTDERADALCR